MGQRAWGIIRSLVRPTFVAVALLLVIVSAGPRVATAHTGLDRSVPADGATVEGPLRRIVLFFTGTPIALDDTLAVADAEGNVIRPAEIVQDGQRIVARFASPLPASNYAVSWQVRSDDTHTVSGTFGFAVTAPPETTVSPTTAPDTTQPETTAPPGTEASTSVTTATESPTTSSAPGTTVAFDEAVAAPLLDDPGAGWGADLARAGRLVAYPSLLGVIGLAAFGWWSFAGPSLDRRRLARIASSLGWVVAVGSAAELIGLADELEGLSDALGEGAGRAALVRLLGGLVVGVGGHLRLGTGARSPLTFLALGLLVVSFGFDGHTVTEGPRAVHFVVTVAHVGAGGVWAGGVLALAVLITARRRRRDPTLAVEMVLPFSFVAAVALAAVTAAGLLMAWFIDSGVVGGPSSPWGRVLWVKVGLVAATAALGGYNHFRLRPQLAVSPDDAELVVHLQRTVIVETALLAAVGVASAILVTASTV